MFRKDEAEIGKVKDQHLKRCHQFLCEELQSSTSEYLPNRVFFLSGREMLNWKTSGKYILPQPSHNFLQRKKDFEKLENMLKHHLTTTSIHTKYGTHFMTGTQNIKIIRICLTLT